MYFYMNITGFGKSFMQIPLIIVILQFLVVINERGSCTLLHWHLDFCMMRLILCLSIYLSVYSDCRLPMTHHPFSSVHPQTFWYIPYLHFLCYSSGPGKMCNFLRNVKLATPTKAKWALIFTLLRNHLPSHEDILLFTHDQKVFVFQYKIFVRAANLRILFSKEWLSSLKPSDLYLLIITMSHKIISKFLNVQ